MLEFFFRHYDPWVDRYIVFDDGSTDGSIGILKAHPKVELRSRHRKYPHSHLISQIDWMDEVWKESRGCADWVVIVDMDEHLLTQQSPMRELLERYKSQGITLVPALGFQMLSEDFPEADELLVQSRTWGTPWQWMCKLSIINPDAIEETNFSVGRHTAKAVGRLKLPRRDELLLFHYKNMGFERTFGKQISQYNNVGKYDADLMWHYAWPRHKLRDHWNDFLKRSSDMSWPNYYPDMYPYFYRWWRLPAVFCFIFLWFKRANKFFRNPICMIKRLKIIITSRKYGLKPEKYELFIDEITRSPIKREIYQMIMTEGANEEGGGTVAVSNGKDERGVLIQCLHSFDTDKLQCHKGIQKAIAAKEENEKKYQKEFDTFVITSGKGFQENAVEFAKNKNVKLVSRNDLIEFISQVKVS